MILTILVFLIILTVLVLIHEWGHFLVAKRLGIKVEEFGFGLPPRAFGIKRGETVYSINWLPIGGFVKLYGEDVAGGGKLGLPVESSKYQASSIKKRERKILNTKYLIHNTDLERTFFARPVGQRAAVVIAGVLMNTILAVIIFYAFLFISNFKTELPLLGEHRFFAVTESRISDIVISSVAKNSPAEKIGIKPPVKIISVNGAKITNVESFVEIINKNKGKEITIKWQEVKTNKTFAAKIVPRVSPPKNEGAVGVAFFPVTMVSLSYQTPVQKIFSGVIHPFNLLVYQLDVLGKIIGISIKEKTAAPLSETVAGPVGIYSLVGNIVKIPDLKERILQVLNLSGILSVSLAFFNILPIPALDGGRLFFILIEGVTRRKVPARFEGYAHAVGMAILLTLIALITFHDLTRIFSRSFLTP